MLKRPDQVAFSTLWLAVIIGCGWFFLTTRGLRPIDIDRTDRRTTKFMVDINSGSKHEFDCLPGIGPKTAAAITTWRSENGPFESIDAIVAVPGVSKKLANQIRPFLYIKPSDQTARR